MFKYFPRFLWFSTFNSQLLIFQLVIPLSINIGDSKLQYYRFINVLKYTKFLDYFQKNIELLLSSKCTKYRNIKI